MTPRERKYQRIYKLLKSGNFTVAYHDNGQCSVYEGHYAYDDLPEGPVREFNQNDSDGYAPEIVRLLVEVLGGICESI